jgi:hypothetical protein
MHFPDAVEKIEAAHAAGLLKAGNWGDGNHAVCMMSAMVPGAKSMGDCVTAGWPEWLAALNVSLFDASVGADDEDAARYQFALDVAKAVSQPRDYDKARDLFLIRRLDDGEHSSLKTLGSLKGDWTREIEAVKAVVTLLERRINGEDVADEMKAAGAAAYAAYVAAYAAAGAAYVAAYAAADAARAADAAYVAAYAAARVDLNIALNAA